MPMALALTGQRRDIPQAEPGLSAFLRDLRIRPDLAHGDQAPDLLLVERTDDRSIVALDEESRHA
jgi:hypothetical protein